MDKVDYVNDDYISKEFIRLFKEALIREPSKLHLKNAVKINRVSKKYNRQSVDL